MTAHVAVLPQPNNAGPDPFIVRIVGQASAIRRKHKTARVIGIYSVAACGSTTEVEAADGRLRHRVRPFGGDDHGRGPGGGNANSAGAVGPPGATAATRISP